MKEIIVIADDLGFCSSVDRGIIEAWRKKVISGASLLANFSVFNKTVSLVKKYELEVGFHLNLTQGKPVSPSGQIKTLIDKKGDFLEKEKLLILLILGQISKKHLQREIRSQILKIEKTGLKVNFANSHQNAHLFPGVFKIFLEELKRVGIKNVRSPLDCSLGQWRCFLEKPARKFLLFCFGILANRNLDRKKFFCPDHFFSFTLRKNYSVRELIEFLENLSGERIEISFHPGYADIELKKAKTYLVDQREKELEFILSPGFKNLLGSKFFKLSRYSLIKNGND